jgi:hypothetical protein
MVISPIGTCTLGIGFHSLSRPVAVLWCLPTLSTLQSPETLSPVTVTDYASVSSGAYLNYILKYTGISLAYPECNCKFLQSENLCCKSNMFFCIIDAHHLELDLKMSVSCWVIMLGETDSSLCLWIHTDSNFCIELA